MIVTKEEEKLESIKKEEMKTIEEERVRVNNQLDIDTLILLLLTDGDYKKKYNALTELVILSAVPERKHYIYKSIEKIFKKIDEAYKKES